MKDLYFHKFVFFRLISAFLIILNSSLSFAANDVCIGDFNNDFAVNNADLAILASDFGRISCGSVDLCESDIDKDNDVDGSDLSAFVAEFGRNDCRGNAPIGVDLGLQDDEQQGGGGLIDSSVRILNGNAIEARTDFQFPSPNSLGLAFRAIYNSRSGSIGNLGYGWTHSYAIFLQPSIPVGLFNYLMIIDSTGREIYFSEDTTSPGTYLGAFKEKSYVVAQSGEYVWYRLDGSTFGFSTTGKLIWVSDEKGNRLVLSYDIDGKLEAVTDMSSTRVLTFNYNIDGLLVNITGPVTNAVPTGVWAEYAYDVNQNLSSVVYADGSGYIYDYEDTHDIHNLTNKTNKANHLLKSWSYNSDDQCVNHFNRDFGNITFAYYDDYSVEITDGYEVTRRYMIGKIDSRKRIIQRDGISNAPYSPNNNAKRWAYDSSMRLTEIEFPGYPNNTINRYQDYDECGNARHVILAAGSNIERVVDYEYHPKMNIFFARIEASTLGEGNKITIYDYDNDDNDTPNDNPGNLIYQKIERGFTTDASGNIIPYEYITKYGYNDKGQILTIDEPRIVPGDVVFFAYDEITGNLLSITRPLVGIERFSDYDNAGRACNITDANGNAKFISYDALGRITKITDATDESFEETVFNLAGMPASVTDADGVTYWFHYDVSFGRLAKIVDMQNNYVAYQYDEQGNKIDTSIYNSSDVKNYWQRFSYDNPNLPGALYRVINPDNTYQEFDYDNGGNVSSITDPNSHNSTYEYDQFDRPIRTTQPYDTVTIFTYDSHGNFLSVSDAENHLTQYRYDDMGRMVSTISVDTGLTKYAYDESGNLVVKVDANENIVNYTYDLFDRLTEIDFQDSSQNISYTYDEGDDGKGLLTGMIDPSGSTVFAYDSKGNIVQKSSNVNGHIYSFLASYTYAGRKNSITYPTGRSTQFYYNNLGNVSGVSTGFNGITTTLMENIGYLPFGPGYSMTSGTGSTINNVYDKLYRLISSNPGSAKQIDYTYDSNNNITGIDNINNPDKNKVFVYDDLNRLVLNNSNAETINYSYDKVGNRLNMLVNGQEELYSYIPNTDKISSITCLSSIVFSHDLAGKITSQNNTQYIYNFNDQLIRVEEDGHVLGEYAYNGLGQRIRKQISDASFIYHYDFDGNLIAESSSDGIFSSEYLYLGNGRLAKVNVNDGNFFYYLNNHLGTPLIMTDSSGVVVWEASYKPFGEADVFPSSSIENNFRFPGQYYDSESELHYNWHRNYNPKIGRFMTPDPIGLVGGINVFIYAQNNPIRFFDFNGLSSNDMEDGINPYELGQEIAIPRGGGSFSEVPPPKGNLGTNPFRGKSFDQIDEILTKRGFLKEGPNPKSGEGAYFHPNSGRKYYLDQGKGGYKKGMKENEHIDVHRMKNGKNLEKSKRKYPLGHKLYERQNPLLIPGLGITADNFGNAQDHSSGSASTVTGDYVYPTDWFPILEYSPENPDEITPGSSVDIQIVGEKPPFTWTVSGTGFSLSNNVTNSLVNTLFADISCCGAAVIEIIDSLGQRVSGVVRSTNGQWVFKGDYCGLRGFTTYYAVTSDNIRDLILEYELIAGNKKQTQASATNFAIHESCGLVSAICEDQNLIYCPEDYRDNNCIDGDFVDYYPFTCDDEYGYHCFCVYLLGYYEWECY